MKIRRRTDFNDFEVGKQHTLTMINVFDKEAHFFYRPIRLKTNIADEYILQVDQTFRISMERTASVRAKETVAALESVQFVEKIKPHTLAVPHGDRCDA